MSEKKEYKTVEEFWPFYVNEHLNKTNRLLHFVGTTMALFWLFKSIKSKKPKYLLGGLINGYGFAWIGHFFFEKNKPATFQYPTQSFVSDWKMLYYMATGQMKREVEIHRIEES